MFVKIVAKLIFEMAVILDILTGSLFFFIYKIKKIHLNTV